MYKPLAPCPGCRRHVRAAEGGCPFCGAVLVVAPIPNAATRLARGALFVFASSVTACGGSTASEPTIAETGSDTSVLDTGSAASLYGAPAIDSGAADDGTVDDTGGPMTKYGAPPEPDTSTD